MGEVMWDLARSAIRRYWVFMADHPYVGLAGTLILIGGIAVSSCVVKPRR